MNTQFEKLSRKEQNMSRFQNNRSNILSIEERAASARKCIALLGDVNPDEMSDKDATFFRDQLAASKKIVWLPSELQLQWLRDMVERYAQGITKL